MLFSIIYMWFCGKWEEEEQDNVHLFVNFHTYCMTILFQVPLFGKVATTPFCLTGMNIAPSSLSSIGIDQDQ